MTLIGTWWHIESCKMLAHMYSCKHNDFDKLLKWSLESPVIIDSLWHLIIEREANNSKHFSLPSRCLLSAVEYDFSCGGNDGMCPEGT